MTTQVAATADPRIKDIGGLASTYLFDMAADLSPLLDTGPGPLGNRLLWPVIGGTFEGPRIRGEVVPGGGDWPVHTADGSGMLDVWGMLRTDDGALIYMSYTGRLVAPDEVFKRMLDPVQGSHVDPASYYFRTNPVFETGSEKYAWLNDIVAIGYGYMIDGGVAYRVFQID